MNVEKIFVGRIERIINVWPLYLGVGATPSTMVDMKNRG